ncbi:MAG: 3-methylornithyl-N6-L-lysine dehydrogenase PylD [Bacillota bacterium]|jgi:pyrrolysine biosynthesis protein PylD
MTRLTEKDIDGLSQEITRYEKELLLKTGMSLREIACFAAGISLEVLNAASKTYQVAVIPITSGLGIIGGFAHSVASIVNKLGFPVAVTEKTDVSGFYEAVSTGKDIVFMADDERFIAFNLRTKKMADNGEATGRGYVSALYGMAKGLKGCDVLVLGYGQVGSKAVDFLSELGANAVVFETDQSKVDYLLERKVKVENNLDLALPNYSYIVDATPEGSFISKELLHPKALIAAPGVPLALTADAYQKYKDQVIHDPLQIGVATMLALALS